MAVRAKHFEYWINLDEGGSSRPTAGRSSSARTSTPSISSSPLARCSLSSLAYFARQKGVEAHGSAFASGTVTRREEDDRYGFTEIECRMEVELVGELADDKLKPLLESAEWGCFVGASLSPAPRYKWRVNGRNV